MVGFVEEGKKVAKKQMGITLHGLWGPGVASPLKAEIFTASGAPAVSTPVLRSLAGKPGAAKKALLELEGQDAPADSSDLFDGKPPCCLPCARCPLLTLAVLALGLPLLEVQRHQSFSAGPDSLHRQPKDAFLTRAFGLRKGRHLPARCATGFFIKKDMH